MNMKWIVIGLFIGMGIFSGCGAPDADPSNADGAQAAATKNFAYLINHYQQGKTTPTPWAGYWWPYSSNGIATGGFGSGASPAGKYDAARGGTTHAQDWEAKNHGSKTPKLEQWWGHCNGWCAASALFPEPHAPAKVNGITFQVADIKAILSEAAMEAGADYYGERMKDDNPGNPAYHDTIPAQYFLVLTNYIGRLNQGVLIDRYTGYQVWNQPLAGYRFEYPKASDYLGPDPANPGVYRIMLTSKMWWMEDGVPPDVQTGQFDYDETQMVYNGTQICSVRELKMELWLDGPVVFDSSGRISSSGDVVVTRKNNVLYGGDWRMGEGYFVDAWPDYMWVPYSVIPSPDRDKDDPYGNPEIDIDWVRQHILVAGGADDPSVHPSPVAPAPSPEPSHSTSPIPVPSFTPIPPPPHPTPTHTTPHP